MIVASGERAEYAMPAAALSARSGDAVLFATRNELPEPTAAALKRHEKPDVFVLGPDSVIGEEVLKKIKPLARRMRRIDGPTPVQNAIEFARFQSGSFGWGAEVPGQNFTIASTSRPLDAVGAASLGTNGVFAPLLLTDDAETLPRSLESYLLDVQPGFEDDPSLSVFNHVWILGDEDTISVEQQARIDEVSTLDPCRTQLTHERVRASRPHGARADRRGRAAADGRLVAALRAPDPQPHSQPDRRSPEDHPARALGESEIARLERLAVDGEHRGQAVPGEPELPSIRRS